MTDSFEIKSQQIVRIVGSKFIFDHEVLESIINADINKKSLDLPICPIIINGATRTGKSFFLNFLINHLFSLENKGHLDSYSDGMLKDYFKSRRGSDVQTLGCWVFNKIFIHDGKAILIMDTQGIFDRQLQTAVTISLICISCICSCLQIYNLDKQLQEDHLDKIAYFSAHSKLMQTDQASKIGQDLCLLIRDWANFSNNFDLAQCKRETEQYKIQTLCDNTNLDRAKIDTRERIFETYENVDVRLCPHPGHLVTESQFSGRLSDVRDEFKIHVEDFIRSILKNSRAKKLSPHQDLLCKEYPGYLKEYITLFEDVRNQIPEALNILETTEKLCQENSKTKTVNHYKRCMLEKLNEKSMTVEEIKHLHSKASREAKKLFNKMYILGKDNAIENVKNVILREIESEYQNFILMAQERNLLVIIMDTCKNFVKSFGFDINSILSNPQTLMFIAALLFLTLNLFTLPFQLFNIETIISVVMSILKMAAFSVIVVQVNDYMKNASNANKNN